MVTRSKCPIYKFGPSDDPSNYRGITLLNYIRKIFTSILCKRISDWEEARNLLPEEQFGFRKNRRTTDCIFIFNTLIEKAKAENTSLFVCFVDLKKAFDSVNHNLLWEKLKTLGLSHQMLKVLQSMYSKATSRVRISTSEATDLFPCQKGVKQGCTLSPLLFSLFLTGLEVELKKNEAGVVLNGAVLDTMLFADDIVLLSCTSEGLKKHLLTLETFCHKHMLEVNTSKTKICVFEKNSKNQHYKWKDTDLESVKTYKYLGVWVNSNGNCNTAKKFLGN